MRIAVIDFMQKNSPILGCSVKSTIPDPLLEVVKPSFAENFEFYANQSKSKAS